MSVVPRGFCDRRLNLQNSSLHQTRPLKISNDEHFSVPGYVVLSALIAKLTPLT